MGMDTLKTYRLVVPGLRQVLDKFNMGKTSAVVFFKHKMFVGQVLEALGQSYLILKKSLIVLNDTLSKQELHRSPLQL